MSHEVDRTSNDIHTTNELDQSQYGILKNSPKNRVTGINPFDFLLHTYVLASTGSGKTSLIRNMIKHLEAANQKGVFTCAVIYLDMKGSGDTYKIIRQCDKQSFQEQRIHLLDPNKVEFSINPFELPPYDKTNSLSREKVVSRFVGFILKTFASWYGDNPSFVRLERILFTMIHFLYLNTDSPTFSDIHDIIIRLQNNGSDATREIFSSLGRPPEEMKNAVESISDLGSDSFDPILNRIEKFSVDSMLKIMFNARHSTIDFYKLIEAGNITVVNINEITTSSGIDRLALSSFMLKLYFTMQLRAIEIDEKNRIPVILFLDEFQVIESLQLIPQLLAQSRSLGLGLVLAHQNLSQVNQDLRGSILSNCATQFVGRVSGQDSSMIATNWDPDFKDKIISILTTQPPFRWTSRIKPEPGQEQSLPFQFWLRYPPDEAMSDEELKQFIVYQREKYATGIVEKPLLVQLDAEKNQWMRQLRNLDLPEKSFWDIMVILNRLPGIGIMEIIRQLKTITPRETITEELCKMVNSKIVEISEQKERGSAVITHYRLAQESVSKYFSFDYTQIGTADDIYDVSRKATDYYLQLGHFVTLANQKFQVEKMRTDIIAYDYQKRHAISVEIESVSEIHSHPEQVRHNMMKWKDLGFSSCEVWSKSTKIQDIHDELDARIKKDVTIHIVE